MFTTLLSDQWDLLSPAVQQHYGIKDGQEITMEGELAVKHGRFIKLLMPLIRLTGALVPVEEERFKVTVENTRMGNTFYWRRCFQKDGKVYEFKSKMQQFDDEIVEFVGLGIGLKMGLRVNNGGIVYEDKGYVFKLGKLLVPIPLRLFIGKSFVEEFASNDSPHDIEMCFVVQHPWFGFGFSYMGCFNFT